MALLSALGAALVFALACNLDTVLLAMGFAVRGVRPPRGGDLVIALVTTLATWLSLLLGDRAAGVLTPAAARGLGGMALVGIGLWFLLDCLRRMGQGEGSPPPVRGLWGCVSLAAALAVNNAGVGVAAGAAGLETALSAAVNFAVTLLALPLGRRLGNTLAGQWLGWAALPLTGVLLVLLGVWEIAF